MPRERDVQGKGKGGKRKGEAAGAGPANPVKPVNPNSSNHANPSGPYAGRPGGASSAPQTNQNDRGVVDSPAGKSLLLGGLMWLLLGKKRGGGSNGSGNGGFGLSQIIRIAIIVIIVLALLKACSASTTSTVVYEEPVTVVTAAPVVEEVYGNPYGLQNINAATTSTAVVNTAPANTSTVDQTVTSGARAKFYQPKDNETVTIMLYMIATDLESNYGMATNDLKEIVNGTTNMPDNVNIIVYGGGCKGWKNNVFSNSTNLCYKLQPGGRFELLYDDGDKVMTDPQTLGEFIRYCRKNYEANRNILILWDHGGGSITGYGYDQRHTRDGAMSLVGLTKAMELGGAKFDIIGFDACLMATTETAYVMSNYGDYLIGSEESEPGIGWYYTNWVKNLCNNPSISTLEIGKKIADDFVDVCAQQCAGQDTTLSVVDLAEFAYTAPKALNSFSDSVTSLVSSNYRTVSTARSGAKEFAKTSGIDQVDLVDLASRIDTAESKNLTDVILSAIKYNRTSSNLRTAYGLSIYFPYRSTSYLSAAVKTYNTIGVPENYSKCIQAFASVASTSQQSSGSYNSPIGSLFGYGNYASGGSGSSYSAASYDDIYSILSGMMSQYSYYGRSIVDTKAVSHYLADNAFDANQLVWTKNSEGQYVITLPKEQWELVNEIVQNLFVDDGAGYIDYGLDLTADCLTKSGSIIGDFQGYWLSVDGWECAYYLEMESTDDQGNTVVNGIVPCLFNGQRAYLEIQHLNNKGSITGVRLDYTDEDNNISAKVIPASDIQPTDTIVLIADYYNYDNSYDNTYKISDELTWGEGLDVYDVELQDPASANATYKITDIYGNTYWTPVMKNQNS